MLNLYIRTRGHRIDYSFLLKTPTVSNPYKSDIEQPTCILERTEDNAVTLFLSSIPSKRKDHQGTPIRYDLVAKINSKLGNNDRDRDEEKHLDGLTKLIWMWLTEVKDALQEIEEDGKTIALVGLPIESELGNRLDEVFTPEYVEELLKLTNNSKSSEAEEQKKILDKKFQDLLNSLSEEKPPVPVDQEWESEELSYQKWCGGINNDTSRKEWIQLVKTILQGKTKGKAKALLLNIATPQSLSTLSMGNGNLGVLLAKEWSRHEPEEIEKIETQNYQESKLNIHKVVDWGKQRAKDDPEKLGQFMEGVKKKWSSLSRGEDTD